MMQGPPEGPEIICISIAVVPDTARNCPMPMIGSPPEVGVNFIRICPTSVAMPWRARGRG